MNKNTESIAVAESDLRPLIHEIHGIQVMLDRDLANLYGVTVSRLNEQVSRNIERFPERFMHQLTKEEFDDLKSQIVISSPGEGLYNLKSQFAISSWGGTRKPPRVFTEQGVSMLSAVLRSPTAVATSIRIIDTFVAMRRALQSMHPLLARIEEAERRQIVDQARNEERFEKIFDAMQDKRFPPQKLFFDGEFYDAFLWIKDMIKKAKTELIVIDPYFDASVLPLFADKHMAAKLIVVRSSRAKNNLPDVDIAKFNAQYSNTLVVKESDLFHDRFLIIDRKLLVHIGASLNYLGKKCFAASTFDSRSIPEMLGRLKV